MNLDFLRYKDSCSTPDFDLIPLLSSRLEPFVGVGCRLVLGGCLGRLPPLPVDGLDRQRWIMFLGRLFRAYKMRERSLAGGAHRYRAKRWGFYAEDGSMVVSDGVLSVCPRLLDDGVSVDNLALLLGIPYPSLYRCLVGRGWSGDRSQWTKPLPKALVDLDRGVLAEIIGIVSRPLDTRYCKEESVVGVAACGQSC